MAYWDLSVDRSWPIDIGLWRLPLHLTFGPSYTTAPYLNCPAFLTAAYLTKRPRVINYSTLFEIIGLALSFLAAALAMAKAIC